MRQINRGSVPKPRRLDMVEPQDHDRIRRGEKPCQTIYRDEEVVVALRKLYRDKCYLCESQVYENGEVEHFHPWHSQEPERAYDWDNLHWSCPCCNGRKRKKKFKEFEGPSRVPKTLLIDPSRPPFGCRLADLITFVKRGLEAKSIGERQFERVVVRTVEFLNERPRDDRLNRYVELMEAVADAGYAPEWREMSSDENIDPTNWDETCRAERLAALEKAQAIYQLFLSDDAPFSTSMRAVLPEGLRLSVDDFEHFCRALAKYKAGLRKT